jgi:hypothetical protein
MNTRDKGIYQKFNVTRADGRHAAGEKHEACDYFVLDLTHDRHAFPALLAYAESCKEEYPQLCEELVAKATCLLSSTWQFTTVPETTLPSGLIVPAFAVGTYAASKGPMDTLMIDENGAPWVDISYYEARAACSAAGLGLLTESQALAIAHNIVQQAENWSGGAVGAGKVFQGLHKGTVSEGQPGSYISPDAEERSWHVLSNGERIYHFAGNVFSWIFDDVQGDADGVVDRTITADSVSLITAPYPSRQLGMGWRPDGARDWSGLALVRGGFWYGGVNAGVFRLDSAYPSYADGIVGFRCTKTL